VEKKTKYGTGKDTSASVRVNKGEKKSARGSEDSNEIARSYLEKHGYEVNSKSKIKESLVREAKGQKKASGHTNTSRQNIVKVKKRGHMWKTAHRNKFVSDSIKRGGFKMSNQKRVRGT